MELDPFSGKIPRKPRRKFFGDIQGKKPVGIPAQLKLPDGVRFVIDSREQLPYELEPSVTKALESGDYSVEGLEQQVVVERKSLNDLLGVVTSSRDRFERELARLAKYRYAGLLIEASFRELASGSFEHSAVSGQAVVGSVVAWSQRYGVHVWLAGNRRDGQLLTAWMLARAYFESQEQIHGSPGNTP